VAYIKEGLGEMQEHRRPGGRGGVEYACFGERRPLLEEEEKDKDEREKGAWCVELRHHADDASSSR